MNVLCKRGMKCSISGTKDSANNSLNAHEQKDLTLYTARLKMLSRSNHQDSKYDEEKDTFQQAICITISMPFILTSAENPIP